MIGVIGIAKKTICILGLGYIGLPTAAMFATHGHKIIGVDIDRSVVAALNQGEITIEEPYLDIMVRAAVSSGNLTASTTPGKADVFIIAVPTPINQDKTADMRAVRSATESIVPFLGRGNIVILESTSPPGTVNELIIPILSKSGLDIGRDVLVAHSPERVLPGRILIELVENNRIVGGINKESCEKVKELYSTFVKGEIYATDATTAEMCKLMENTFRDVNIALANELALLCEKLGIDAWEVIRYSNKHPRVNIHKPGPGVGGHCIAVDPWFIVEKFPETAKMILLSRQTNDGMPAYVFSTIERIMSYSVPADGKRRKITILGATYKPDVDDARESPILELIHLIDKKGGYDLSVYDPHMKAKGCPHLENDLSKAVSGSHILVLGVNHSEFLHMDFKKIKEEMAAANIFDTRNFWNGEELEAIGFEYHLLGKGDARKGQ